MKYRMYQAVSLLFLTALSLAISGCSKPEKEDEPVKNPVFTLKDSSVTVPATGGTYSLSYTLENPTPDTDFQFACAEDWISSFSAQTEKSVLEFNVAPNTAENERSASVTVSYGNVVSPLTFRVLQAGEEPVKKMTFEVEFPEIGPDFVLGKVTPSDLTQTYAIIVIDKTACDLNFSKDQVLFSYIRNDFEQSAKDKGLTLNEYLKTKILLSGVKTRQVKGLPAMTSHYFLVFGLSEDGELTTPILRAPFETLEPEQQGTHFELSYQIDGPVVKMSVQPSDPECYYYFGGFPVADAGADGANLQKLIQDAIDMEVMFGKLFGKTATDIVHTLCAKGPAEKTLEEIKARTDYIGYAVSIDEATAKINSEISKKEFTTGTVPPSSNQLTLTIGEIGLQEVALTVTTTNNDQYAVYVSPAKDWTGMNDEAIFKKVCAEDLSLNVHQGNDTWKENGLQPGTDYEVFAFGYNMGMETTGLTRAQFKTHEAGNPEKLVFEFQVSEITQNSAVVNVNPNPATATYYWGTNPVSVTAEQIKSELEADIADYIKKGWVKNRAEYMSLVWDRGPDSFSYTGLVAGTEYRSFAIGIYEATGEFATEVKFSAPFRTLDLERSEIKIELVYDKYFDGDALVEAYPKYDGGKGMAVLPVKAKVDNAEVEYLYQLFNGKLLDQTQYPDNLIIKNLEKSGLRSKPERMFYCKWNTDQTLLAVTKDKDGKYGPVFRAVVNLSKDGVSPISEFTPPAKAAASRDLDVFVPMLLMKDAAAFGR